MKEREVLWIIPLAFAVGILGFLSLRVLEVIHIAPSFAEGSEGRLVFPLPRSSEVIQRKVFLAPLKDEEIVGLRDVFSFAQPYGTVQEEILPLPEETSIPPDVSEEVSPSITLKGVVVSPKNQVAIVEVDGEIFFLTPEKPLSGELRLVKVDKKRVVLTYRGREFVFSLEE